jgi:hypothetical protein
MGFYGSLCKPTAKLLRSTRNLQMTPPKTILLYCEDDDRRSLLLVQMRLWNYRATVVHEVHDLPLFHESHPFDLVLIVSTKSNTDGTVLGEISVATNQIQIMRRRAHRVFDPIGFPTHRLHLVSSVYRRQRSTHRLTNGIADVDVLSTWSQAPKFSSTLRTLGLQLNEHESTPCYAKDMK